MAREKKITVKALLNQEVKGRRDSPLEALKYPLYLEVTYDRKYTKFPFGDNWFSLSSLDKIKSDKNVKGALKAVEKIIRLEISRDPNFKVTGVSKTIKSYLSPFQMCLLMLLIRHIGMEVEEKLPSAKFKAWLNLEPAQKITAGFDLLGENAGFLINDLLATYQLLTLMEFRENIVTWLIYTTKLEKVTAVEKALNGLENSEPPYEKYGGVKPSAKKMSAVQLVTALDKMALLVTDNQISISINYLQY
jgi:hypothetical protein